MRTLCIGRICFLFASISALFSPSLVSAHEVYVLPADVVARAITTPSFSLWDTLRSDMHLFVLWALIATSVVLLVFFVSISRSLERALNPLLEKLPTYAPVVSRITIGLSFIAAAYYGALFGPELPLMETFGAVTPVITGLIAIIGLAITIGIYARVAALIMLVLFGIEIWTHGTYMLTYSNYLGELLLLALLGAHRLAVHHHAHDLKRSPRWFIALKAQLVPHAFLILRVGFGISLLYASLYAKVIHNNLALAVTEAYPNIVTFFGFEPHFLILGAAIIEITLGIFFILGIEIRFTSLFVLFWLSVSLWYFGESVWPHIILIGIPIAFICYGYDKYSLEGYFFKRKHHRPIL